MGTGIISIKQLVAEAEARARRQAEQEQAERLARIRAQHQDGIKAITQALEPAILRALAGEKPDFKYSLTKSKQNVDRVWLEPEVAGLAPFLVIAGQKSLATGYYCDDRKDFYINNYGTRLTTPPDYPEGWPFEVYLLPKESSSCEDGVLLDGERPAEEVVGEFLLARQEKWKAEEAEKQANLRSCLGSVWHGDGMNDPIDLAGGWYAR